MYLLFGIFFVYNQECFLCLLEGIFANKNKYTPLYRMPVVVSDLE